MTHSGLKNFEILFHNKTILFIIYVKYNTENCFYVLF